MAKLVTRFVSHIFGNGRVRQWDVAVDTETGDAALAEVMPAPGFEFVCELSDDNGIVVKQKERKD